MVKLCRRRSFCCFLPRNSSYLMKKTCLRTYADIHVVSQGSSHCACWQPVHEYIVVCLISNHLFALYVNFVGSLYIYIKVLNGVDITQRCVLCDSHLVIRMTHCPFKALTFVCGHQVEISFTILAWYLGWCSYKEPSTAMVTSGRLI